MFQLSKVTFCIPANYKEILELVHKARGIVEGASFATDDYEELFAWHVDEIIEVKFGSPNEQHANQGITKFMELFNRLGVPHAIVTSAMPADIPSGKYAGVAYINPVGDKTGLVLAPLLKEFDAEKNLERTLRANNVSENGINLIYSAMADCTAYGRNPAAQPKIYGQEPALKFG